MSSPEAKLLDLAVGGDSDALAKLLEQCGPQVRRRLAGEIPPRWQAVLSLDDVLQETYIDAFLDVSRFHPRGSGSFLAWLTTLAKRNLIDALRMLEAEKRGRKLRRVEARTTAQSLLALHEQLGRQRSTPSRHAARNEARACLREAIERLPPKYRHVVEMYDLEGLPVVDVAKALKRSPGAVFMLRSRAHRCLLESLGTASLYLSDTA